MQANRLPYSCRYVIGRIMAPMPDAASPVPELDPPDPERVYRNYVAQCRRMGITPTPRDRARKLIEEWMDALAAGLWVPPPKH